MFFINLFFRSLYTQLPFSINFDGVEHKHRRRSLSRSRLFGRCESDLVFNIITAFQHE